MPRSLEHIGGSTAIFWKAYFVGYLALGVAGLIATVYWYDWLGPWEWYDHFDFVLLPFGLVGVYGYAFGKRILERLVWKVAFVAIVAYEVIYPSVELFVSWEEFKSDFVYEPWMLVMPMVLLILVPYYVALFLYAWRSQDLWQSNAQANAP